MIGMTLAEIAALTGGELHGNAATEVPGKASVDSRDLENGDLFAAIAGEHVDGHSFASAAVAAGAGAVLCSRAVEVPCVVVDDVTVALGLIARAVIDRAVADNGLEVIAVTGSQGKTSVKDMLSQVLSANAPTVAPRGSFNNELGVPLTVLGIDPQTRFLVVEMGSRGIGHIEKLCAIAPPTISAVLNVGVAHLGEFGSRSNIARAKGEIVEALGVEGTAILNADDELVIAMRERSIGHVVTFGSVGDVSIGPVSLNDDGEPQFDLSYRGETLPVHIGLIGAHQASNSAAAAAVALTAGISFAEIVEALGRVTAVSPMRMSRTVNESGVTIINDAYNANPESVAAALRALISLRTAGRTYAVLGEMLELGDSTTDEHRVIGVLARDLGIDCVVAVGAGAEAVAAVAAGAGDRGHLVNDTSEAVRFLRERLSANDVVMVKASRGARLERVAEALATG